MTNQELIIKLTAYPELLAEQFDLMSCRSWNDGMKTANSGLFFDRAPTFDTYWLSTEVAEDDTFWSSNIMELCNNK